MSAPCYDCVHRRNLPGSAHSNCVATRGGGIEGVRDALTPAPGKPAAVTLNPHGVRMGWAYWPVNFDPIWVRSCALYQEKQT